SAGRADPPRHRFQARSAADRHLAREALRDPLLHRAGVLTDGARMMNPVASAFRQKIPAFRRKILPFRRTILLLALLVAATSAVEAQVIDRIMAAVNGQTIMLSDVNAAIEFGLIVPPAGTADPLAFVLERLIERTLILAEVERFQPPEPDPIE